MIDVLFDNLACHFFVLAFDRNRIISHFYHSTVASCQLTGNDLSLFSFFQFYRRHNVLPLLFILELLDEVAILGEGLQLDGQHRAFGLGKLIVAEGQLDESVAGEVKSAVGGQIREIFEDIRRQHLFRRTQMRRVVHAGIGISS